MDVLLLTGQFCVGSTLILAGILKLKSRPGVMAVLEAVFPKATEAQRKSMAALFPWVEAAVGALWLAAGRQTWVLTAGVALFIVFSVVTFVIASRRLDVSCQCFGPFFRASLWSAFARSLVLLALSLAVGWWRLSTVPSPSGAEIVVAVLLVCSIALELALIDHLNILNKVPVSEWI